MSLLCRLGLHARHKSQLYWRCTGCPGMWSRTYTETGRAKWRRVP